MKGILIASIMGMGTIPPKHCPKTNIVLIDKEPWSKMDQINFNIAQNRCPEKYKKSPCLKKFIRWGKLRYGAICGAKD